MTSVSRGVSSDQDCSNKASASVSEEQSSRNVEYITESRNKQKTEYFILKMIPTNKSIFHVILIHLGSRYLLESTTNGNSIEMPPLCCTSKKQHLF